MGGWAATQARRVPVSHYFATATEEERARHPAGSLTKHESLLHNAMTYQVRAVGRGRASPLANPSRYPSHPPALSGGVAEIYQGRGAAACRADDAFGDIGARLETSGAALTSAAPVFSGGVALQTPRRIFICVAPQFGDYLDVRRRTLPPAEALAVAKAFLPSFDYIGFD